ncbi:MAG: sensor histidine kinase [bacterium]
MKFLPYRYAGRLKVFLFVTAVAIILGLLWHSHQIVTGLRAEARNILLFYAQFYARAANEADDTSLNFIFDQIIKRTEFPIILAGADGEPSGWKGIHVPSDSVHSLQARQEVREIMGAMKREIDPIPITYQNPITGKSDTLNYLYYGDSTRIKQLQRLPYFEISVVGLFILVGFFGFNSIRRGEQQFIWVGMAKETAHQLGTPISSLLGWIELLHEQVGANGAHATIDEMQRDVERLSKVASRFSQIGSRTDLREQDVVALVEEVAKYFRNRLPQMRREVTIAVQHGQVPPVPMNRDLFEWVLENLIRNALDAIESPKGEIHINIQSSPEKHGQVIIDIKDNGRGIEPANRKNIFRPGFSTKKRGWGLGLSLAKRIVEEYHHGKLLIKESRLGEGTTMRIVV